MMSVDADVEVQGKEVNAAASIMEEVQPAIPSEQEMQICLE